MIKRRSLGISATCYFICYLLFLGTSFAGGPTGSPIGGAGGSGTGGTPDDDTVTSAKIVNGAIVAVDIADNTITLIKLITCANEGEIPKMSAGAWVCGADAQSAAANPAFDNVQSGTNTSATMTVGTGGTMTYSGSGIINASRYAGVTTIDNTEFSMLNNASSELQAQINGKASTAGDANIATVGTVTSGVWNAGIIPVLYGGTGDNTAAGARTNLGLGPADNVTFGSVTAAAYNSSALDNTRGVVVPNTTNPTGSNLESGKCWATDNSWLCRNNDNTVTFIVGSQEKTESFVIDNTLTTSDYLLFKAPRAMTIVRVDGYASADNVIGALQECASDNVSSCTAVDSTDWTITNAITGFSVSSGFENDSIAAGAWVKWLTTSVGTQANNLSVTIRYRE